MDLKDKSFTVCKEKEVGRRLLQGEGAYVEGVSPEGPGLLGGRGDVECGRNRACHEAQGAHLGPRHERNSTATS